MDFTLPEHLPGVLAEMDAFIEAEIKPLEREHIQYFDQRREYARTDWDHDGIPTAAWEELLAELSVIALGVCRTVTRVRLGVGFLCWGQCYL